MHSTAVPLSATAMSSPSLSLASFDDDSDVSVEHTFSLRQSSHILPSASTTRATREVDAASPFVSPDMRDDLATKSDIAELRAMIQDKHSLLESRLLEPQSSTPAPPPSVLVPETAFADALRAELAVQMAKVSVLEEEVRKLRGEKQGLRAELERVENAQPMYSQLTAANTEMQRLYVERQGLWDERADLWRERQSLWDERADLWKERGDLWEERGGLWVLRDKLTGQVESLTKKTE